MLEINPNCGVFYPPDDPGTADLILANDRHGHRGFAEQVVRAALARRKPDRLTRAPAAEPVDDSGA